MQIDSDNLKLSEAPSVRAALDAAASRLPRIREAQRRRATRVRALSAAGLAVLVLVMVFTLPLRPRDAWASVDGIVLEYEAFLPKYFAGPVPQGELTAIEVPGHFRPDVFEAIQEVIGDWSMDYSELGETEKPLAWAEELSRLIENDEYTARGTNRIGNFGYMHEYAVFVMTANEEAQAELMSRISSIQGLSEPRVHSKDGYFRQRYPELFTGETTISVDGKVFRFPEDFSPDEARFWLTLLDGRPGKSYYFYYLAGLYPAIPQRRAIAPFSKLTVTDERNLNIESLSWEDVPAPLSKTGGKEGVFAVVPEEVEGERQIITSTQDGAKQFLKQELEDALEAASLPTVDGWRLRYLLYPIEYWRPGVSVIPSEMDDRAEKLFHQYESECGQFGEKWQAELLKEPFIGALRYVGGYRRGKHTYYEVYLYADETLLEELRSLLDAVDPTVPVLLERVENNPYNPDTRELAH